MPFCRGCGVEIEGDICAFCELPEAPGVTCDMVAPPPLWKIERMIATRNRGAYMAVAMLFTDTDRYEFDELLIATFEAGMAYAQGRQS